MDLEAVLQRGYRYALALTHNATRAEDLLHDSVAALLGRGGLRSAGYLES